MTVRSRLVIGALVFAAGSMVVTLVPLAAKAPAGKQGNWLRTVPGKGYVAMLRLDSPTAAALTKSWKLSDIEKVNAVVK